MMSPEDLKSIQELKLGRCEQKTDHIRDAEQKKSYYMHKKATWGLSDQKRENKEGYNNSRDDNTGKHMSWRP